MFVLMQTIRRVAKLLQRVQGVAEIPRCHQKLQIDWNRFTGH